MKSALIYLTSSKVTTRDLHLELEQPYKKVNDHLLDSRIKVSRLYERPTSLYVKGFTEAASRV